MGYKTLPIRKKRRIKINTLFAEQSLLVGFFLYSILEYAGRAVSIKWYWYTLIACIVLGIATYRYIFIIKCIKKFDI